MNKSGFYTKQYPDGTVGITGIKPKQEPVKNKLTVWDWLIGFTVILICSINFV